MSEPDFLAELVALRDRVLPEVVGPVQFPEPPLRLNVERRQGSKERIFKHLHQSCLMHRENLCAGSQVKHLYLLDAYIDMARAANPLGIYMVARSMLEFSAFLFHVSRLLRGVLALAATDYVRGGQAYFDIIVRARFATSRNDFRALLTQDGLPEALQKPFRSGACVQALSADPGFSEVAGRYASLSDFVHHNLGSATTGNAGSAVQDMAVSAGGGVLLMPKPGPVTQYQYPVPSKGKAAIESTSAGFLQDSLACIRWINEMPDSPYSQEAIRQNTGTDLGVSRVLEQPVLVPSKAGVSRNEPCPCGSGRKYKKCCLQ